MEKVRPWCGQPSDRGRLKNRTVHGHPLEMAKKGVYTRTRNLHYLINGCYVKSSHSKMNGLAQPCSLACLFERKQTLIFFVMLIRSYFCQMCDKK